MEMVLVIPFAAFASIFVLKSTPVDKYTAFPTTHLALFCTMCSCSGGNEIATARDSTAFLHIYMDLIKAKNFNFYK